MKKTARVVLFFLLAALSLPPCPVRAADLPSEYLLQMARVDLMMRKGEFLQAAQELGRVSKGYQEDPLFQEYAQKVLAALYDQRARIPGPGEPPNRVIDRLRVTMHKRDADSRSDQSYDHDGLQVNQHLESDVKGKDGTRANFVLDLDGFKDGHNDVRYRTVLADFYDGPSHVAIGDSATFTSPYFLRGSRVRGLDILLSGELNEFQAVAGGYPYWMESRDEYIYPRTVVGVRDRWRVMEDRIRLGANFVNTRDNAKLQTDDGANPNARVGTGNQTRDNFVYSLDQEVKLIQDVWYLKSAEAYSFTDDNLNDDRFGQNTKLKDTSFEAETLLIQPWAQWTGRFERTGPDFRLFTDLPQGAVDNPKGISSDRELIENFVDFQPFGPFDLDLQASWYRNDLAADDTVEATRQGWFTANLGILVPYGWPKPRFRGTLINTLSSPGSKSAPAQTRTVNLRSELTHFHEGMNFTEFVDYRGEFPQEDKDLFSPEEQWEFGARMSTTLLDRILFSPHYTFRLTDNRQVNFVDSAERLSYVKGTHHEAGVSSSIQLWSTSSLGLSYTYLEGKMVPPDGTLLTPSKGHSGTVSFTWPYTRSSWNKRERLTIFPGITAYFTRLSDDLERRPVVSSELTLAYQVLGNWKAELKGEYLYDKDMAGNDIRTAESRISMLWTAQWK